MENPDLAHLVYIVSVDEQARRLAQAEIACYLGDTPKNYIKNNTTAHTSAPTCNRTWDEILCWPETLAGHMVIQPCPFYINGFRKDVNASRLCLPTGQWYVYPYLNKTWTNYTECTAEPAHNDLFEGHLERIQLMYNIGYGLSLVSLVTAVIMMYYFRRLQCPRNKIHTNLFLSFILRATVCVIRDNSLVQGLGLPEDVDRQPYGTVMFRQDGSHWRCKLLLSIFHYSLGANYMWVLVEGLYLHSLLFLSVFSEKSGVTWCIMFGWVSPLVFVIPWVLVRLLVEDTLCWNTHPTPGYFWIMQGPIVATVIVNFGFFLNIVRVLFTKLRAPDKPYARRHRQRKLAKATLVLIPLFGVHYIVFLGLPDNVDKDAELVKLYFEMFFNSFQGFVIASLFCFLNGDVQAEIRKSWIRYRLSRNRKSRHSCCSTAPSLLVPLKRSHPSSNSSSEDRCADLNNPYAALPMGYRQPGNCRALLTKQQNFMNNLEDTRPRIVVNGNYEPNRSCKNIYHNRARGPSKKLPGFGTREDERPVYRVVFDNQRCVKKELIFDV